ncbi:MAG: hypothetical protein ABSF95_03705 [Verrucomicrobiota bacterium]|jgi:hypothetical protein
MTLGIYTLDQSIESCSGLTELSPLQYTVIPRAYEGERIFKAPDSVIDGRTWAIFLSALPNGKIYKIAAQFISDEQKSVDDAFSSTYSHYERQFGRYNEVTQSGACRWDQPFGNLILGKSTLPGLHCVNCIATSDSRPALTEKPRKTARDKMRVKLSENIQVGDSVFTVTTTTRGLFMTTKPHSVVIPYRLHGKRTASLGLLVKYTTCDPEVLEAWHEVLCQKVQSGMFDVMVQGARTGDFPFEEDEMDLAPYLMAFRCP